MELAGARPRWNQTVDSLENLDDAQIISNGPKLVLVLFVHGETPVLPR